MLIQFHLLQFAQPKPLGQKSRCHLPLVSSQDKYCNKGYQRFDVTSSKATGRKKINNRFSKITSEPKKTFSQTCRKQFRLARKHTTVADHSKCTSVDEKHPPRVIIGVDPDVGGALAIIWQETHSEDCVDGLDSPNARVLDTPVQILKVGKTNRRRHDAAAMWRLVTDLNLYQLSPDAISNEECQVVAFIEAPQLMPMNGKQSIMQTGFGFGVWTGVLTALGAEVRTVPPRTWKTAAGLTGKGITKDDSRALAVERFPDLADHLKRKKDHGRAEALLIADFGKTTLVSESNT